MFIFVLIERKLDFLKLHKPFDTAFLHWGLCLTEINFPLCEVLYVKLFTTAGLEV